MAGTRTTRRSSSKAITYVVLNHFQLGVTAQPDKVQIASGATPMARNVEWREQGGFRVRKGVGTLTYGGINQEMQPVGDAPVRFFHFVQDANSTRAFLSQYLVACDDGKVRIGVDAGPAIGTTLPGAWAEMAAGGATIVNIGRPTFVGWDRNVYITLGDVETTGIGRNMVRWDGATGTKLGTAAANDYAAPTGGNMPLARYAAAWSERMWVACCLGEPAPSVSGFEPGRIRFSHPGRAEDWATDDYIGIGQQGDVITGIAPMRDMLIVFKRSSTYALLGSGSTNFRVVELSATIGCTGEFTRDNQGRVLFWDGTIGLCRFDGKAIVNLFGPLLAFIQPGPDGSITRCAGVVTDGEKVYVSTDFLDPYGSRVPDTVAGQSRPASRTGATPLDVVPGQTTWANLVSNAVKWAAVSGIKWLRASIEFANMVWVWREGAGWTTFTLLHPQSPDITMLGELAARLNSVGDVGGNRRVVYGLFNGTVPLYMSDRYDDGRDWWSPSHQEPLDAFYMTPWLHGGLPAQVKRWKAPRIIQEADSAGVLLVDVFYDFNYGTDTVPNIRRTLRVEVVNPLSYDSYVVNKPGTIGRAKAVMLVIRAEHPRHWGVSSLTIPVHPKVLR